MRTRLSIPALLLIPALAVAAPVGGDTDQPAPAPTVRHEDLTCEDWIEQLTAPDDDVSRPDLWAACQHERLVRALADESPERLAAFLSLEGNLQQMCDALVELGPLRTGGGT